MIFRCPECRTRRMTLDLMRSHLKESGHKLCDCGGYHFKHRPFSTYCHKDPMSVVRQLEREGCEDAELLMSVAADQAFTYSGRIATSKTPIPF